MSKTICSKCRYAIQDVLGMFCMYRKLHTEDGYFVNCHCFSPKQVFHRIIQSPEALAETYMFNHDGKVFKSLLLPNMVFNSREEAYTATVKKLKEVHNA